MPFHTLYSILIATFLLLGTTPSTTARQNDVAVETLMEVELPAERLPEGEVMVQLAHWTWEPEATASIPAGAWQKGIVIDHVLTGSYMATSGDVVLLVSGDDPAMPEKIAAETEFTVHTGEGAAYLQNASSWEFRNGGSEAGAGLGGGIFSTAEPEVNTPTSEIGIGFEELASRTLDTWGPGDGDTATFSYWQATLQPGAEIPAPEDGAVQLVALQPGTDSAAKLTVDPDGAARNDGAAPIEVYGVTLAG